MYCLYLRQAKVPVTQEKIIFTLRKLTINNYVILLAKYYD